MKPVRTLLALLAGIVCAAMADATTGAEAEFARLLEAGAQAEARHEPEAALVFYRQAAAIQPDNPFVLQKIAQQISDALFLGADPATGRDRVQEALRYAHRAAELAPGSAVNRLSLAILYGRLAGFSGVSEKVQYARLVRRYAEEAHTLDPDYAWACHILARWHLEMAALGSAKRTLAAVLFGGLPKASREEGLRLLERAVALEPDALAHRVELGIAYERLGRRTEAREQWEMSLRLPSVAIYDEPARLRAREELARLDRSA